jgi:hypothetical protein
LEATAHIYISNNILKSTVTGNLNGSEAIELHASNNATSVVEIWNNLIYDFTLATGILLDAGILYAYNNTVYNCFRSYNQGIGGTFVAKNNISYAVLNWHYGGTFDGASTNNLTGPTDGGGNAPGSNPRNAATVTFVDEANDDFHLAPLDSGAQGHGVNLSQDPGLAFSDDIDGQARIGPWDIGADKISKSVVRNAVIRNATVR